MAERKSVEIPEMTARHVELCRTMSRIAMQNITPARHDLLDIESVISALSDNRVRLVPTEEIQRAYDDIFHDYKIAAMRTLSRWLAVPPKHTGEVK